MDELFFRIFESLPRQGPGDDESTRKAFRKLTGLPECPEILDAGCGTGKQTLVLAEMSKARITALDNHRPFIDTLERNIRQNDYGERIHCIVDDMNSMSFLKESFDVIWCEGAIFAIGLEKALHEWKALLRPNGYLTISELVWFEEEAPQEVKDFFKEHYPDMKFYKDIHSIIDSAGYRMIDYFQLPDVSWWTDYYIPIEKKIAEMRPSYQSNKDSQGLFDSLQMEIEMHRKYSRHYGYGFYIMQEENGNR